MMRKPFSRPGCPGSRRRCGGRSERLLAGGVRRGATSVTVWGTGEETARGPRLGRAEGPFGRPAGTPDGRRPARRSGLGVAANEVLHALPGVGRRRLELRLLAIEEAMGGAWIDGRVVLDPGLAARRVEGVDIALGNALVGAAKEREYRASVSADGVDRLGPIRPPLQPQRPAVEPDHPGVAEAARRLEVREHSAEAEADGEERAHRAAGGRAQVHCRRRDVGL